MTIAPATVYTHIERDNRLRWHPVIVIKRRGVQVWAATGLQGYYDPAKAAEAGQREAKRLEKGS